MDREPKFDAIVELFKRESDESRQRLLRSLKNALSKLTERALSLPTEMHELVEVRSVRSISENLQSGRFDVRAFLHWSSNRLNSSATEHFVVNNQTEDATRRWRMLEVPEDLAVLYEAMGFTTGDYLEHRGSTLMSGSNLWPWIFSAVPLRSVSSWVLAGVPDPSVAIEWMQELRETSELALISYRSFAGDLDRAKAWQRRASAETRAWSSVQNPPLTYYGGSERPAGLGASAAPRVGLPSKSSDWLEEIVARARTVKPSIRRVPHWPARIEFQDEDLVIELEQFPRVIKGVVVVGHQRRWCEFDPSTFDIVSRCDTGEDRYVAGMSISWFIDCSITIHRVSSGSSMLFRVTNSVAPKSRTQRIHYIPTPTFREKTRELRTIGSGPIVRHKVSGHIRKLPQGRRGSQQAHSNAPLHIRKNMSPAETYVEPHFRGTEAEKTEIFARLSRYSALGDAMSDLGWD